MKLNNTTQIKSEDYDNDYADLVDQLAETLNPFMQEVSELADERIDFENRVEVLKKIDITVDANGKPTLNDKINCEKSGVRGFEVIRAYNLTNVSGYPTSHPFISYTQLAGTTVRIDHISGLVANNKYQLTLVIY
jgi:hypothetical protein